MTDWTARAPIPRAAVFEAPSVSREDAATDTVEMPVRER